MPKSRAGCSDGPACRKWRDFFPARRPSGCEAQPKVERWGPGRQAPHDEALGPSFRWDDDCKDGGFSLGAAKGGRSAIEPVADVSLAWHARLGEHGKARCGYPYVTRERHL
jgi:hypothetical protein